MQVLLGSVVAEEARRIFRYLFPCGPVSGRLAGIGCDNLTMILPRFQRGSVRFV